MRLRWVLVTAILLAGNANASDAPLQDLARFLAKNYCPDRALVNREISFTAPLTDENTTFLHFTWKVTARDQYGRSKGDELFGVVRYSSAGVLKQLVLGGPLVGDNRLRVLRDNIRAARRWPKEVQGTAFGPDLEPGQIGGRAVGVVSELLGASVRVEAVRFCVLNSIGEPDGTWHVELKAVGPVDATVVKTRLEPFTGKVILVDVYREGADRLDGETAGTVGSE